MTGKVVALDVGVIGRFKGWVTNLLDEKWDEMEESGH